MPGTIGYLGGCFDQVMSKRKTDTHKDKEENNTRSLFVLFRLLVGAFVLSRAVFLSSFIAQGPGREKYFLALFTGIFLLYSAYIIIGAVRDRIHSSHS